MTVNGIWKGMSLVLEMWGVWEYLYNAITPRYTLISSNGSY